MNSVKAEFKLNSGQRLEIIQGDITQESVDVIVNAANANLEHGGGVALAIARAGGDRIIQESRAWVEKNGPVSHTLPAITNAGRLPAKKVIHAVGPIWGSGNEKKKLRQVISSSLKLVGLKGFHSISFPAISTGIYHFPLELAAEVFMDATPSYFEENPTSSLQVVRIVLYDNATLQSFYLHLINGFPDKAI